MTLQSRLAARVAAALCLCSAAWAGPVMLYNTSFDTGSGFYTYNLILDNRISTYIVSGVIVVNGYADSGGTVIFGVGPGSVIAAPPEANGCPCEAWSFLAPIPPFANNLAYSSPDDGGDISPGGTLAGFSFQSLKDPATLNAGDFDIVLILRGGTTSIDAGDAQFVPEPSTWILLGAGLVLLALGRRRANTGTD